MCPIDCSRWRISVSRLCNASCISMPICVFSDSGCCLDSRPRKMPYSVSQSQANLWMNKRIVDGLPTRVPFPSLIAGVKQTQTIQTASKQTTYRRFTLKTQPLTLIPWLRKIDEVGELMAMAKEMDENFMMILMAALSYDVDKLWW